MDNIYETLNRYALVKSNELKVPENDNIKNASFYGIVLSAFGYYAGVETNYFSDPFNYHELPLSFIFGVISIFGATSLESICGKPVKKQIIGSIMSGGITGGSIGLGIAGIAFSLLADIFLTGGFTIIGGVAGYLYNRKGKKTHELCGTKLNCSTWICPKCKKIIKPSKDWIHKDNWNILDLCDYLDTGGLEMNTFKALSFIKFSKILELGDKKSIDSPVIWNPSIVKDKLKENFDSFSFHWNNFLKTSFIQIDDKNLNFNSFFETWEGYYLREIKK